MQKKRFYLVLIFCILILLSLIYFAYLNRNIYSFEKNTFSYSMTRATPKYEISLKEKNESYGIYYVNYQSRDFLNYSTRIYGLLFIPNNKKNVPGLILLPGGAVPKENEATLASKIASMGYAVLTIDQRGIGETGGYYLNFDQDYEVFSNGEEPIQHLSVYDGLAAYDVMKKIDNVNPENIAIAGESMGGRSAIIAAAIDKRLKGVIAISSSGFHVKTNPFLNLNSYFISIDPDNYIGEISPNKVFMLHGDNDTMVYLNDAQITYNLAKEPKRFFIAEDCGHGYCDKMYDELKEDLKLMFEE